MEVFYQQIPDFLRKRLVYERQLRNIFFLQSVEYRSMCHEKVFINRPALELHLLVILEGPSCFDMSKQNAISVYIDG